MLRNVLLALALITLAACLGAQAASAESYTTRIEPRPFYGAVVTLEEGVRVIRPLPPDRHVIINPDNKTPLSLSFNETHVSEHRGIENHTSAAADGNGAPLIYGCGGGVYGGFDGHPGRFGHMGHHHVGQHHHGLHGVGH